MINFFRKARRKMAEQNRLVQYLRYAIGEIVLVVIGILIALQINSWNEKRIAKLQEKRILKDLHEEFEMNLLLLDSCFQHNQKVMDANKEIMELIADEGRNISETTFDKILFESLEQTNYFPSQNSITELIQSGKMQYLSNEKIKVLLYKWASSMDRSRDAFLGVDGKAEQDIVPYLSEFYPLKDMDMHGPLQWQKVSRLSVNKLQILDQIQFENLIDDQIYRLDRYLSNLAELRAILVEILEASELK